jgi:16S rRNA processing protein RimM
LQPFESQYIKVGYVARPHGVDGTVLIIPDIDEPSVFESMNLVRLQNVQGGLFPARIESARIQQQGKRSTIFVKFSHISDQNKARELKNMPVFVNKEILEGFYRKQSESSRLISFVVRDEENHKVGTVEDVFDNPAHPILTVADVDGELLIPFVDEYIAEIDDEKSIIYCRNMNQLAETA